MRWCPRGIPIPGVFGKSSHRGILLPMELSLFIGRYIHELNYFPSRNGSFPQSLRQASGCLVRRTPVRLRVIPRFDSGHPWPSPFGSRLRRAPIPLSCGIVLDFVENPLFLKMHRSRSERPTCQQHSLSFRDSPRLAAGDSM